MDLINFIVNKITRPFASAPDSVPEFVFAHKRSIKDLLQLIDQVHLEISNVIKTAKQTDKPIMILNRSTVNMLSALGKTREHLLIIYKEYNSNKTQPYDYGYSKVFVWNFKHHCKEVLNIIREAKEQKVIRTYRLSRYSLLFMHILSELKAIFPEGKFVHDQYKIAEPDANNFWRDKFGSRVFVYWENFIDALQTVHKFDASLISMQALKSTINLTRDHHVSIFEFDVFTKLFAPWSTLSRNWLVLAVLHPGYKAFLTFEELDERLQEHVNKPGSYIFRLSSTLLGQWIIGHVTRDKRISQVILENESLSQALTKRDLYLYPNGCEDDPSLDLLKPETVEQADDRSVAVSQEQYETYCEVGSSFRTCKVCFENDKDVRIEPCNHLLCSPCLANWQESGGQDCPYCRGQIERTTEITLRLP